MVEAYLPILVFLAVGIGMSVVLLGLGLLLGPHNPDAEKNAPFECGFDAFEDARIKFDVRYYLVAILFIIFDLEIAFLFPWAVVLDKIGLFGLVSMGIFLLILIVVKSAFFKTTPFCHAGGRGFESRTPASFLKLMLVSNIFYRTISYLYVCIKVLYK